MKRTLQLAHLSCAGIAYLAAVGSLCAQVGLPTVDKPRYAIILKDLKGFQSQVKSWSSLVQAAHESIDTLGSISAGIRDLEGVVHDGVRGLTADVASQMGFADVFKTLHDVQSLYDDTSALIRDVRALPDEAKYQLRRIGIETKDLESYLREGVMHDTLHELGAEDWEFVARHPGTALTSGVFGRALVQTEDYLTEQQRTQLWGDFLASLTDEQKRSMAGFIGPQFAAHLAEQWFSEMDKRVKRAVDYRDTLNKLQRTVHGEKAERPTEKDITSDKVTEGATHAIRIKIAADSVLQDAHAARVLSEIGSATTQKLKELDEREQRSQTIDALRASDTEP